jgi:hypothetical protein
LITDSLIADFVFIAGRRTRRLRFRPQMMLSCVLIQYAIFHVQAARLLAAFREFKRRESVGLVPYFANKLAALEEALLGSRWVVRIQILDADV